MTFPSQRKLITWWRNKPPHGPDVAAYHSASVLLNDTHFGLLEVDQTTKPFTTCTAAEVDLPDQSESEKVSMQFVSSLVSMFLIDS